MFESKRGTMKRKFISSGKISFYFYHKHTAPSFPTYCHGRPEASEDVHETKKKGFNVYINISKAKVTNSGVGLLRFSKKPNSCH